MKRFTDYIEPFSKNFTSTNNIYIFLDNFSVFDHDSKTKYFKFAMIKTIADN
ncbi:hypothetical protein L8V80_03835 [Campylobacter lari]|uniref:Uncharacterized protein n=1 Tax=Campylobacter lari TaxID=201 RepID=A0A7M1MHY9_CAMLA|nr:hypothetical protein [Campylobacter lari]MCR6526245.1 hypothetical protein [Campylobacter lari]MCV3374059.1 hypothetical protein [Campylobacter lari]QOQ99144.1 hypothetical protein HW242_05340 [Campylobacter lari]